MAAPTELRGSGLNFTPWVGELATVDYTPLVRSAGALADAYLFNTGWQPTNTADGFA